MCTRGKNESRIGMYDKESFYFLSTPYNVNFFTKHWKMNFRNIKYKSDFKNIHIEISDLSRATSWLILSNALILVSRIFN